MRHRYLVALMDAFYRPLLPKTTILIVNNFSPPPSSLWSVYRFVLLVKYIVMRKHFCVGCMCQIYKCNKKVTKILTYRKE